MNLYINAYISGFSGTFTAQQEMLPWQITSRLPKILQDMIPQLGDEYHISNGIAVHRSATVEEGAVLKGPAIVSEGCFIGAHAYIRGGVFLGKGTTVGTGCEIKTSIILYHSAVAHFNFVGDSVIGSYVNLEAGAVVANHFNERQNKQIWVTLGTEMINTNTEKFGALIGDNCKIGANAVLSPGTVLAQGTLVKRLELVEQLPLGKHEHPPQS